MSDSTWLLIQLCVAGWTGLLMCGLLRLADSIWQEVCAYRADLIGMSKISPLMRRAISAAGSGF